MAHGDDLGWLIVGGLRSPQIINVEVNDGAVIVGGLAQPEADPREVVGGGDVADAQFLMRPLAVPQVNERGAVDAVFLGIAHGDVHSEVRVNAALALEVDVELQEVIGGDVNGCFVLLPHGGPAHGVLDPADVLAVLVVNLDVYMQGVLALFDVLV